MWVVPWAPEFVPSSPSQYLIHDNTFLTSSDAAEWAQGILLYDDPANPGIQAKIWHNTIELGAPLGEGIDATYTTGTEIKGNTITGAGEYAAIALWGATRGTVIANDVERASPPIPTSASPRSTSIPSRSTTTSSAAAPASRSSTRAPATR